MQPDLFDTVAEERKDIFDKVAEERALEQQKPGIFKESLRHVARTGSRIAESIAGFPGDMAQLAKFIGEKSPKFLQKDPNFIQRFGQKVVERIPTSDELAKFMGDITGGFTDPQSATEEFSDSVAGLASILAFGKDPTKIRNLLKPIGKAFTAKGVAKGVESLGGGEKAQATAELGTLFLMELVDPKMTNRFISDKYNRARSFIPDGTMLDTTGLTKELENLEKTLSKGLTTSTKAEVKNVVSEARAKVSGGAFPAEEMVDFFHDINERMTARKLYTDLSKSERKNLKFRFEKFKNIIGNEIEKYGKSNPKFFNEWKEANAAFSTVQNSKKVSRFLERNIGSLPNRVVQGAAIETLLGFPTAAAGTVASLGLLKSGELMYRIATSKTMAKLYATAVKSAAEENLPATIKALTKLEDEMQKSLISDKAK